ncbi:hypothetical protein B0H67DRAFT_564735 [Lasiosphaeris hirsuta]|uniref:Uncharacterized protein n=1 Tax=Lasiosphaeris hirsuta TaxID=260670 RepID=A0AA40BBU8_9PEZI|nr:hypothetical protein B0H67DRAFT_564735 [Lasiosphaeris hirsuta]
MPPGYQPPYHLLCLLFVTIWTYIIVYRDYPRQPLARYLAAMPNTTPAAAVAVCYFLYVWSNRGCHIYLASRGNGAYQTLCSLSARRTVP